MFTSIFNDVLGPVMRGPSSSHTAGSHHIGRVVRDLLGEPPKQVRFTFDTNGSYAKTYTQQGVDLAFASSLMGHEMTDESFPRSLKIAADLGIELSFEVRRLAQADHPNYVVIEARGANGAELKVEAKSVGGGTFRVVMVNGYPVDIDGKSYATLVERPIPGGAPIKRTHDGKEGTLFLSSAKPKNVSGSITCEPCYFVQKGPQLFDSAEAMLAYCHDNSCSLGKAVLDYESIILGLTPEEAEKEMLRRYAIMKTSVEDGLDDAKVDMQLLEPTAGKVMQRVRERRVAIGGIHAEAGARAMAAMHTCNSRGVVCAAPTGGAAGTLPGVMTALDEHFTLDPKQLALMLFAAGGIGLILAERATFAAEVAGCQVEIGAAGAMAAAAVVEFAGGTAHQACDAAAISFQNTMGSVCDLVQGICEVPCHTRNAVAASSAFTCADLILGGYRNPVPLDETIDAVFESGKMLPSELRCTALGGLAVCPSALSLKKPE